MDRTECERFWANQFRGLLTLAGWVTPGERDECRHEAAGLTM